MSLSSKLGMELAGGVLACQPSAGFVGVLGIINQG